MCFVKWYIVVDIYYVCVENCELCCVGLFFVFRSRFVIFENGSEYVRILFRIVSLLGGKNLKVLES